MTIGTSQRYRDIPIGGGDTAKPYAMQKRLRIIRRYGPPRGSRFLDCGCGAGDYVFELTDRLELDAHGVEYDSGKVQRAKLHPKHGHRVVQGDIQDLKIES